ncbi:hypothetical protein IWQ61_002587 [Dispira simplex]|nr:hypothetical protein IWQ61_002587 [Dispira simplex]
MAEQRHICTRLDYYYRAITAIILSRQNPATGLIPASVAVNSHGDYRDAWVRDNVYSIMCVFGLALAYRRIDDEYGRAYELEHATVKLMRGLLFSMMRQASKVELFKYNLSPADALHAKYNTSTGDTVVGDQEWGHLQIDATSLFLLMLAQMTTAGLSIIYTQDEVDFVQNLVFYVERAYRTPDYGIWERGNKMNHGEPELNSSSIGIVVAALQAINGVNLFGPRGGPQSIIHVLPDELTRNVMILYSALPRESSSKEIDAALLPVIGYPAYAVADEDIINRTREEIVSKLQGRYGCRRFLRDGHQTVVEDTSRLYYEPRELKIFENIECEWPLFFTYFILDGLFRGDTKAVEEYSRALEPLLVDSTTLSHFADYTSAIPPVSTRTPPRTSPKSPGITRDHFSLIPEVYYVPQEAVEEERANPHSQDRKPNDNVPLVWANSLYYLGKLVQENLVSVAELDPLGRRLYRRRTPNYDTVVQLSFLSEDETLRARLATFGLETQTLDQLGSVTVCPPSALQEVYTTLGMNDKLGLSGRPPRPLGTLSTCRLYRVQGRLYAFVPQFLDKQEFYLASDNDYLVTVIESQLAFVQQHWGYTGRPTLVILLTHQMFNHGYDPSLAMQQATPPDSPQHDSQFTSSQRHLLHFMMNMRSGVCCNGTVRVRLGNLTEMIPTSSIESLDFLVNKNEVDWLGILRGCPTLSRTGSSSRLRDLGSTSHSPGLDTDATTGRLRRNTSVYGMNSGLKTPVERKEGENFGDGYFSLAKEMRKRFQFKLLDPELPQGGQPSGVAASPSHHLLEDDLNALGLETKASPAEEQGNPGQAPSPTMDNISLTLNDPTQVLQAISMLTVTNNLYDQMDLLHYLVSCHGLTYYVESLDATVHELVEEVYMKAQYMKVWGVVRQAAGVLGKVVNNLLTMCITDLVVRLKQLTIGHGPDETFITRPLPPDAINDILLSCCKDDPREISLVQEVIINLADLIQANPSMFNGLMRLRTHFIIIALREEISRLHGCDEEEALDLLLQMSPYELKILINTILSGPSLCRTHTHTLVRGATGKDTMEPKVPGWRNVNISTLRNERTIFAADKTELEISVQSAGFNAGNFSRIAVNRVNIPLSHRGLNVVVIDPVQKALEETVTFDTHQSAAEANEFSQYIRNLESHMVVVVAVRDECAENFTSEARQACELLGSRLINRVGYRDSWCLIGYKNATADQVAEVHSRADQGPTDVLHMRYRLEDLSQRALQGDHPPNQMQALLQAVSGGRWLRRRKNDGALNRVPQSFYPQVWQVLSTCQGLTLLHQHLPRDPLVYEKTPEETSFALRVESFLDATQDPAERQIAVECLMALALLHKAHPDAQAGINPQDQIYYLDEIFRVALHLFWSEWTQTHRELFSNQEEPIVPFDEQMARRLFYDLPATDLQGTVYYLVRSALSHINSEKAQSFAQECVQQYQAWDSQGL